MKPDHSSDPIESALHQRPDVTPPDTLFSRLNDDIPAPNRVRSAERVQWHGGLIRQWLPRLAFASLFLMGAVWITAQNSKGIPSLEKAKTMLATAETERTKVREQHAEWSLRQERLTLRDDLRRKVAEVRSLTRERADLVAAINEIEQLNRSTQTLRKQLAGAQSELEFLTQDPLGDARKEARSVQCVSNLKNLGIAYHRGKDDAPDSPPNSLDALLPYAQGITKLLVCPGSEAETQQCEPLRYIWKLLDPTNVTHETVLLECPHHKHVCLQDASVHSGSDIGKGRILKRIGKNIRLQREGFF